MTPKAHGVIRDRDDLLYDHQGHGDFCGGFDLVYDPKRLWGHNTGRHDLLYDPEGHVDHCGQFDLVLTQKVKGSVEVALTYLMTSKIKFTFLVGLT